MERKEIDVYNAKLPELKEHEGKYVLIHGEDIAGIFTSYDDAVKYGYEKFGLEPFWVRRIQVIEQVQLISRFVDPCPQTSSQ